MQYIDLQGVRKTLEEIPEDFKEISARHLATVSRVALRLGNNSYRQLVNLDEARELFSGYGIDIDETIVAEGKMIRHDSF